MNTNEISKIEDGKRIISIITNGLMRCVENRYKSSNTSILTENKFSNNVSKELGFPKDKSVSMIHEN